MTADDWGHYWRSRAREQTGAALVDDGNEHENDLAEFWHSIFSSADTDACVLDLACGAGAALRQAAAVGIEKLAGADISAAALASLQRAMPGAVVCECSASDTPFESAIFDIIVSQFGIEYAGLTKALPEAVRLLAPRGLLVAIIHMKGSGMVREVEKRFEEGRALLQTNFIALAKDVFETAQKPNTPENAVRAIEAAKAFEPAKLALAKLASRRGSLAEHLYTGTQTMYTRVSYYELKEIHGWLDSMDAEIKAYTGRMGSMMNAAVSEKQAMDALTLLQKLGCEPAQLGRLQLAGRDAGWVLRATKL